MQELTLEFLNKHKQDLIRYENENKGDFRSEINETDKIIRELTKAKITQLNEFNKVKEMVINNNIKRIKKYRQVKIPICQKRLI